MTQSLVEAVDDAMRDSPGIKGRCCDDLAQQRNGLLGRAVSRTGGCAVIIEVRSRVSLTSITIIIKHLLGLAPEG
jgi:hypothetical protein